MHVRTLHGLQHKIVGITGIEGLVVHEHPEISGLAGLADIGGHLAVGDVHYVLNLFLGDIDYALAQKLDGCVVVVIYKLLGHHLLHVLNVDVGQHIADLAGHLAGVGVMQVAPQKSFHGVGHAARPIYGPRLGEICRADACGQNAHGEHHCKNKRKDPGFLFHCFILLSRGVPAPHFSEASIIIISWTIVNRVFILNKSAQNCGFVR